MALDRRARLAAARLYLVCDARRDQGGLAGLLEAALRGGTDIIQLRDSSLSDDEVLMAAAVFRRAADTHDALFVLNDRPDLAVAAGADGVHVGQEDATIAQARGAVGENRLVGRSTHAPGQLAAAGDGADYASVGPVHATPTKPGRPATGLDYVRHAAAHARLPWFAIGGLDGANVGDVIAAGARRIVVVRALADAADPEAAARSLRSALESQEAPVGAAQP